MSDPNRTIPFMRNGSLVPSALVVAVTTTPQKATTQGADMLKAAGVTAFTVSNPNPFPVWYKGGNGSTTGTSSTPVNDGNYIMPGATLTQSSTRPDWLCVMPDTTSLIAPFYAADGTTPLYDMSKAKLVFVFGSGL